MTVRKPSVETEAEAAFRAAMTAAWAANTAAWVAYREAEDAARAEYRKAIAGRKDA